MFHVGQKIVCVKSVAAKPGYGTSGIIKGKVYHIRGFESVLQEGFGIYLEEIFNPICPGFLVEFSYHSDRFRPAVEKKTDISIFTKILNSAPTYRVEA